MGVGRIFLKTFEPLSLMKTYRMSLISAGSISLDSTLKEVGNEKEGETGRCQMIDLALERGD
jgi:hypothetical protein